MKTLQMNSHGNLACAAAFLLTGLILAAGPAAAQSITPEQAITYLDTSGDGKVEVGEYQYLQQAKFAQFDADRDEKLQLEEFSASLPVAEQRAAAQSHPTFDTDRDGGLTLAEFNAYHAYVFTNVVDLDKDGFMSAQEFAAFQPGAAASAEAAPASASGGAPGALAKLGLDHNRDGKTELNEYLNFQLPKLATADENGNGRLARDEFKASLAPSAQGRAVQSFQAFDRDKDRALDQQEFLGYHAFVFKTVLDKNKDGFVDADEWAQTANAQP